MENSWAFMGIHVEKKTRITMNYHELSLIFCFSKIIELTLFVFFF